MIEKSLKTEITSGNTSGAPAGVHSSAKSSEPRSLGNTMNMNPDQSARLFEVVIAGIPLRLKSSHDEKTVNELIAFVDRKVREALPLTKTGSIQNAAILASLHLAEEFLLLRRKAKSELENLEAKTQKVISELESSRVSAGLPNT